MMRRPPRSTLVPSTTLFRSADLVADVVQAAEVARDDLDVLGGVLDDQDHAPPLRRGGHGGVGERAVVRIAPERGDRKSTRLNSSHANISYGGFCLKKKTDRC